MTEFEVKRIQQAFDVIENAWITEYEDTKDRCGNPRVAKGKLLRDLSRLKEIKQLLSDYGLMTAGEPQTPEKLANPDRSHLFRFSVSYTIYDTKGCFAYNCKEIARELGRTSAEATDFLREHIEFEHCNDKNFSNLQITLIDQLF